MPSTTGSTALYGLLIAAAAGMLAARIMAANFLHDPSPYRDPNDPADTRRAWPTVRPAPVPTFSSNDRSRWATIRALVDEGTYAIGQRTYPGPDGKKYEDTGIIFESGWGSVDKVMDPATHTFYSSKPTLFPTLLAGEYWVLKHVFGLSMATHFPMVVRLTLFTVNWLPLVIYWLLLGRLIDRFGVTDWGKLYVMAAGCFGTFLATFAISLNNHTVAACTAMFALYYALEIWRRPTPAQGSLLPFVLAGLFAAFTAAIELPALSFLVGIFALLLYRAPVQTLIGFVPPLVLVVAASLATNYLAIGKLTPAYAEFGEKSEWYRYEGSHWLDTPEKPGKGIDYAYKHEGRAAYMFHFLFGHHGLFLLSPIFLLTLGGLWLAGRALLASRERERPESPDEPPDSAPDVGLSSGADSGRLLSRLAQDEWFFLFSLTTYLSIVVVGFYLTMTNNYGGNTAGPRWVFWLTPFWLLTMLPAADRLAASRGGRGFALVCLGVSALSASYPVWNPWRPPWVYNLLESFQLISY